MSSLVAIYEAYLQPALFEVYCYDCHRLIGLSPSRRLAEMLRRVHVCE